MEKFHAGDVMPNFTYETPYAQDLNLYDTIKQIDGKTALVFMRYLGCTACQFEIRQYAKNISEIESVGGQLLVVLQSDPKKVATELEEFKLPYTIICDPTMELYKRFEIPVAKDKEELHDFGSEKWAAKVELIKASGLSHGDYEGEELQLPATFIVDPTGQITFAYYGKASNDNLTAKELADQM